MELPGTRRIRCVPESMNVTTPSADPRYRTHPPLAGRETPEGGEPTHTSFGCLGGLPEVAADPSFGPVMGAPLLQAVPTREVVGTDTLAGVVRCLLEPAQLEVVQPGLLGVHHHYGVARVRLGEGEQGSQVGSRVHHGAIADRTRQDELLVQPRLRAGEHGYAPALELRRPAGDAHGPLGIGPQRLALRVGQVR